MSFSNDNHSPTTQAHLAANRAEQAMRAAKVAEQAANTAIARAQEMAELVKKLGFLRNQTRGDADNAQLSALAAQRVMADFTQYINSLGLGNTNSQLVQRGELSSAAFMPVGSTDGTVASGGDTRFSNARTPLAHAFSHGPGQADEVKLKTINGQVLHGVGDLVVNANVTVPGANTQILFNDNGLLGANANLTFNKTTGLFTVGGSITALNLTGTNTGDETGASIRTKLGITTLSGTNTGDQDLSIFPLKSNNLSDLSNAGTARTNLGLGSMAIQGSNAVAISGGSVAGLTGLAVRNGGTGAFDMAISHNAAMTANRTLAFNLNDATRVITLSGDLQVSANAQVRGNNTGDQDLSGLQPLLVSGTSLKTINGASLLGSGNLTLAAAAGGADTQLQFNDSTAFAGSSNLTFNKTTGMLTTLDVSLRNLNVSGTVYGPGVREKLTATRIYYVRKDGSDANAGLLDTSAGAFLTIQKAIDVVGALDLNSNFVYIKVRPGVYAENLFLRTLTGRSPYFTHLQGYCVKIEGDITTPTNVVISPPATSDWNYTSVVLARDASGWGLGGLHVDIASDYGTAFDFRNSDNYLLDKISIKALDGIRAQAAVSFTGSRGGIYGWVGEWTIGGAYQYLYSVSSNSSAAVGGSLITYLPGTNVAQAIASLGDNTFLSYWFGTTVGTVTGKQFDLSSSSRLYTWDVKENFPGTIAGTIGPGCVFGSDQFGAVGANTNIAFNDNGVQTGSNSFAYDKTTRALTLANAYTDPSNYEQAKLGWNAGVLEIGAEASGTGTLRAVKFKGSGKYTFDNTNVVIDGINTTMNYVSAYSLSLGDSLVVGNSGIRSSGLFGFSPDLYTSRDVGIGRVQTSLLEVNTGTAGVLADAKLRTLTLDTTAQGGAAYSLAVGSTTEMLMVGGEYIGDFDKASDIDAFTLHPLATVTYDAANKAMVVTGDTGTYYAHADFDMTLTNGAWYQVSFTVFSAITDTHVPSVSIFENTADSSYIASGNWKASNTPRNYSFIFQAKATNQLRLYSGGLSGVTKYKNISVKPLAGNELIASGPITTQGALKAKSLSLNATEALSWGYGTRLAEYGNGALSLTDSGGGIGTLVLGRVNFGTIASPLYMLQADSSTVQITDNSGNWRDLKARNIAATGTLSATNLSGTNTGDQDLSGYQAKLVSGTSIKTINGATLLGSGNLVLATSAAGSDTQIQFNDAGAFAASSTFTFNKTSSVLTLGGTAVVNAIGFGGLVNPLTDNKIYSQGNQYLTLRSNNVDVLAASGQDNRVALASSVQLAWSSSGGALASAVDLAAGRSATGAFEINNGTPGTLRDLSARAGTFTGALSLNAPDQTVAISLGGLTASYPALRRNGAMLELVKADLSGYADFKARNLIANGGVVTSTAPALITTQTWDDTSAVGDVYYNSVTLLLHGDGTDQATTTVDSSSFAKTVTSVGTVLPKLSTAQKKFGLSSMFFTSSGSSHYTVPSTSDFAFGTGDFTVEFWMYPTSLPGVVVSHTTGNGQGFYAFFNASGDVWWGRSATNANAGTVNDVLTMTSSAPIVTNAWQHVAFSRVSGVLRCYVSGTQVGTNKADTANYTVSDSGTLAVGSYNSGSSGFNGYLDEVRITKGVARYTANFTVPSAAFPNLYGGPGSTIFSAMQVNVADTSSSISSLLADLQVASASKFRVDKIGNVTAVGSFISSGPANTLTLSGSASANPVTLSASGTDANVDVNIITKGSGVLKVNGVAVGLSSVAGTPGGVDTNVQFNDGGTLAGNTSFTFDKTIKTLRLYNTGTVAGNYERGFLGWNSNVLEIGTEIAGTGVARNMQLRAPLIALGPNAFTPTSEVHIKPARNTGTTPYLLIEGGKASNQAASVAFRRADSTEQMLFAFETTSASNPDGYFGTFSGKTSNLYMLAGIGSGNNATIGVINQTGLVIGRASDVSAGTFTSSVSILGAASFGASVYSPILSVDSAQRAKLTYNSSTDGISLWGGATEIGATLNSGLAMAPTKGVLWSSSAATLASVDAGIGRNAPGVVEVNNGTLGTLADLKIRNLIVTGISTGVGGTGTVIASQGPAFSAYHNTTQAVSSNVTGASGAKLVFNTKEYDTHTYYDATNSKFNPKVAGFYFVGGVMTGTGVVSSANALMSIYKNGVEVKRGTQLASNWYAVSVEGLIYLNGSTDYLELYGYSSSGGTLGSITTRFQACLIGGVTGAAGGGDTQLLFNDAGTQAGSSLLTFNKTSGQLSVGSVVATGTVIGSNLSGTNTGDQNAFTSIAVPTKTTVTAASTTQTLTIAPAANSKVTVDTDNTTKTVTIGSTANRTYVQDTAPTDAIAGDKWVDTTSGIESTYVNDGTSSQWVELGSGSGASSVQKSISGAFPGIASNVSTGMRFYPRLNTTLTTLFAWCSAAPASDVVVTLLKNGVAWATVTILAGQFTGTASFNLPLVAADYLTAAMASNSVAQNVGFTADFS